MKNNYFDLIEQSYYFPQEGFDLRKGYLTFHGVSLSYLIKKYGTPFKLCYLPSIGNQIKRAKNLFRKAIKAHRYNGRYFYCYCTKCSHFHHVINEALKHDVHLETSSSFDIDLVLALFAEKKLTRSTIIIHNGYKTKDYLEKIIRLNEMGFKNSIIVLDSAEELDLLIKANPARKIKVGLRMAIDEEPQSAYYTSRLGIPSKELISLYTDKIKPQKNIELKMLHFFVDSGIKDTLYYWDEFKKGLDIYVQLKKKCKTITALNIGGGFPVRNHLGFEYNYEYMVNEIVSNIKQTCTENQIDDPDIFTEFGKYTVGESGAVIFEVVQQKQQNDNELWYMINNSLMNTIPDAWSIHEKFILLPINKWNNGYSRVNIGGISCDHSDYYNSEDLNQQVILPTYENKDKEPLYLGFFHTGAYQDSISGYGGIKHCLIPSPKKVIIDLDDNGNFFDYVYRNEQTVDEMFRILGYQQ